MSVRAFKSLSPQELEAAIASAVSALTGTAAEVTIGQWKEVSFGSDGFIGQERYELQLALIAGKSIRIARASLKDEEELEDDLKPL